MHTLGIAGDFLPSCADGRSDARPRPSMCVSFERFILRKSTSPLCPGEGGCPLRAFLAAFTLNFQPRGNPLVGRRPETPPVSVRPTKRLIEIQPSH